MSEDFGTFWCALHVYYYEQADGLLLDCLEPVTGRLRSSGEISGSFFLRYWMGGPHVRWRCQIRTAAADEVMTVLWDAVDNHLQHHPSRLEIDADAFLLGARQLAEHEGERPSEELSPDNSLRWAEYRPEYEKYGGPLGIRIAEELFGASSSIALRALRGVREKPSRRLGVGYLMLLAGARAAGLDGSSLLRFLARYCRFWSRYVPDELSAGWAEGLARQRGALVPVTEAVLGRCADGEGWQQPAGQWMSAVHGAWEQIRRNRSAVLDGVTIAGAEAPTRHRSTALLLNHLHTHHNRLGLLPAQEAYVAFLAQHVVSEVLGRSGDADPDAPLLRKGDAK